MNKIQIKWTGISISLFIVFSFFTPFSIFFRYGIVLSIIEGLICAFFVAMAILEINSMYELSTIDENEESKKLRSVLIPFISFIVFGMLIFNILDSRLNNKIEKDGIFTKATVLNGEEIITKSLRRGTSQNFNVLLSYKDSKTNTDYQTRIDINAEVFNSVYKGQTVEIKYLPQNPSVLKIMAGNDNINKFKNVSNRNINISDIEKLLSLDRDKQAEYLNSISFGWERHENLGLDGYQYVNELKKDNILVSGNKIFYQGSNIENFIPYNDIIKKEVMQPEKEEGTVGQTKTLYETKRLVITKVFKLTTNPQNKIESYLVFEKKQ